MWQSIFLTLPADQQIVWVRVLDVYGQLALALYDSTSQTFIIQTTGVVIPVSPLGDFAGEIITFAASMLIAWVKKRLDIRKMKRNGSLREPFSR